MILPARPRRSCLYMPGANARALEKAQGIPADMVIFDLEDSVAPEAKGEACDMVVNAVLSRAYGNREVVVRINAPDGSDGMQELRAIVAARPDGILVPKIESPQDIADLDRALSDAGAPDDLALWVMIEMPRAILEIGGIASMGLSTRLAGFVVGTNDLAKEMLAISTPDRIAFLPALSQTVTAARAYGLAVIDGVFNDIGDEAGLEAECGQGRTLGFDGKTLIHPKQLEVANRVFSPDPEELDQAHDVIAAFADPANANKGVLKVNGKMTELLHLEQAKRLVEMARMIEVT